MRAQVPGDVKRGSTMTMRRRRVRGDASVVARRAIEREWATKVDRGIDRVDARGRRLSTRRAPSSTSRSSAQCATEIRASFSTTRKKSRVASDGGNRRARDAKRGIGVIETPRRALKRDRTARGEEGNGRAEAQLGNDAENVSFMYDYEKVTSMRDTSPLALSCSVHGPSTSATPPPPPPQRDAPRRPRPVPSPRPRRGPALEPSLLALESCSRPRARPQPC